MTASVREKLNIEVAVVGPGAIGTAMAAALHEAGHTPLLCGRTPREHVILHDKDQRIAVPGPVRTDPAQMNHQADLIFLALKSTHNDAAASWLPVLSKPETVICILQNGVEQFDRLRPLFPNGQFVRSIVWFPAQTQADGSVQLRGPMRLSLPNTPPARIVTEVLQGTRCSVEVADNFSTQAWYKLMQNATAGLMALTHRRAAMFSRADIAQLTMAYLRECLSVARAEGHELSDDTPREILNKFQTSPPDMGTSILTDRQADRPLEWDIRNGVIVRRGLLHGIPTPISDVLVPLLAAASDGPG